MRKHFLIIFSLFVGLLVNAQRVITKSNLNLRAQSNAQSQVLCLIPKGVIVLLTNCSNSWCETKYNGYTGYINKNYVTALSKSIDQANTSKKATSVKYYKNSYGEKVQSPTYYDSPPAGATAECWDGTYSYSRSRRGTCSHHGGVKKWLK